MWITLWNLLRKPPTQILSHSYSNNLYSCIFKLLVLVTVITLIDKFWYFNNFTSYLNVSKFCILRLRKWPHGWSKRVGYYCVYNRRNIFACIFETIIIYIEIFYLDKLDANFNPQCRLRQRCRFTYWLLRNDKCHMTSSDATEYVKPRHGLLNLVRKGSLPREVPRVTADWVLCLVGAITLCWLNDSLRGFPQFWYIANRILPANRTTLYDPHFSN
jgi:hypothetical protein